MGYVDLRCDLCGAALTGHEPCDPPIELPGGGRVLWCVFVCDGPEHHRWSVMVDSSEGASSAEAVVLVAEIRHRRAADELTLRSMLRTVAGVQRLALLVARIEISLVRSVARLERQAGFTDPVEAERLRGLIDTLAPLLRDLDAGTDALRAETESPEGS